MRKKRWLKLPFAGAVLYGGYRFAKSRHHKLISESGQRFLERIQAHESGKSGEQGTNIWAQYPRPQMKRGDWICLNGSWDLNGRKVRVPFPPQSHLSGFRRRVGAKLEYTRRFTVPEQFRGKRVLLHFGAVDQVAKVYVNQNLLAFHEGGYLAWTVDVTDALVYDGENELCVKVTDTLSHRYPYGKQRKKRGGMWYTPVSGIWQSVWMEAVPEVYIKQIRIVPDMTGVTIKIQPEHVKKTLPLTVSLTLPDGTVREYRRTADVRALEHHGLRIEFEGGSAQRPARDDGLLWLIEREEPRLWSPEDPYLYTVRMSLGEDEIESYFALRSVAIREIKGKRRVCLNGKPIFLHGVLDQGYFPEGIYLPGEAQEYERDILRMKELGMNMLRKHIKVEPECFYHYCDLHGMLVIQDMVNSGRYSFIRDTALPMMGFRRIDDRRRCGSAGRKAFFERHMRDTLAQLYNHPCIIAYTIFNEGWGQFEADRMYETARGVDDTRLYDATSGWFRQNKSDFESYHIYFKTMRLPATARPLLVSECGGYSYQRAGHKYSHVGNYGYGKCRSGQELTERIAGMYEKMILPAIAGGACGCVYTQLSDVEDETNGFYTYDRKHCKVNVDRMRQIGKRIQTILEESVENEHD